VADTGPSGKAPAVAGPPGNDEAPTVTTCPLSGSFDSYRPPLLQGSGKAMSEINRIVREYERRQKEIPPDYYSLENVANLFRRQSWERSVLGMLSKAGAFPLAECRILDVGCGSGQWLVDFESWGATRKNLAGIDLLPSRVRSARARLGAFRNEGGEESGGADIRQGNAAALPWKDQAFDIVCQCTVFSSILDSAVRGAVAAEMARVLASGGVIVWYDFFVNNPRNPHVRGVKPNEISGLFPGFASRSQRITLLPPLSRRLVPVSWLAAEGLERMRVLNTHLLVLLKRRSS
jgi:ubiquinone/menaquinone biosynthesis C-methylase UbiE